MRYNRLYFLLLLLLLGLMTACSTTTTPYTKTVFTSKTKAPKTATSKPYKITNSHMKNKWFYPKEHYEHEEVGYASYYGGRDVFHGRKTSTGEIFNKNKLMAAHRTLPLPCVVRVTNMDPKSKGYGRSIKIRVVDRGPFAHINGKRPRIIDISEKGAKMLGFHKKGVALVKIQTLVPESIRLAKGKGYREDPRILLAHNVKQKRSHEIRLAMKPQHLIKVASLSLAEFKHLSKPTPRPKLSPFAHASPGYKVSPSKGRVPVNAVLPEMKPSSIKDLIKFAVAEEPAFKPKFKPHRLKPKKAVHSTKIQSKPDPRPKVPASEFDEGDLAVSPEVAGKGDFFGSGAQESGIFVEAGSYSHLKSARAIQDTLRKSVNNHSVKVSPRKLKHETFYRVRVGPFDTSEQAEVVLAQLEQQGHDDVYIVYD